MFKSFLQRLFAENNLTLIRHIFFINLIYAFPANQLKSLDKPKYQLDYHSLYRGILLKTVGLSTLILLVVYTLCFLFFPFQAFPALFDALILGFIFITLLLTFPYFFNIFYESNDLKSYLALPLSEVTVFRAKMMVLLFLTSQSTLPLFVLTTIFIVNLKGLALLPLALVLGLLYFLLFTGFIFLISLLFMQGMTKILARKSMRTGFLTFLNSLALFLNLGLILLLQNANRYFENDPSASENALSFGPLSLLLSHPLLGLIGGLFGLLLLGLCFRFFSQRIKGRFFQFYQDFQEAAPKDLKRKQGKPGETTKTKALPKAPSRLGLFLRYQGGLINESSVITQSILSPVIIPLVIFIPNLIRMPEETLKAVVTTSPLALLLMLGLGIALYINIMPTSLNAVMFSLERNSLSYLKALPVSFIRLFFLKSLFATIMTSLLPVILLIATAIYLQLGLLNLFLGVFFFLLIMWALGWNWQIYDLNHLNLNWLNVSDLYSRSNRTATALLIFVAIFASIFLFVALFSYFSAIGKLHLLTPILLSIEGILIFGSALRTALFFKRKSYHS